MRDNSFAIGSYGYIGTGYNNTYLTDFWQYDPVANTWTQKANYGGAPVANTAGFATSYYGYIGTGDDQYGTKYNDLWKYNPNTNQWTQMTNFPGTARQWAVGFSINGYGYLGTGLAQSGDENDFWRFTPPDIGINEINPTNQISVFPNPASNNITIENKQQANVNSCSFYPHSC